MIFKGKSVMEVYDMIKNDPVALKEARARVSYSQPKVSKVLPIISQAIQYYDKHNTPTVKVRGKNLKLKGLKLDELVNLILSDKKALDSVRQYLSRNKESKSCKAELYRSALKQRNMLMKKEKLLEKLLKQKEKIDKEILKINHD